MAKIIEDHKRGDTWEGVEFLIEELIDPNELQGPSYHEPIDLTGVSIVANFKASKNSCTIFTFSTDNGLVTIPTPLNGRFFFCETPKIITYSPNTYFFDVQLTFPDGFVNTIMEGTWTIVDDITKL